MTRWYVKFLLGKRIDYKERHRRHIRRGGEVQLMNL
jgi:hypothetical protein